MGPAGLALERPWLPNVPIAQPSALWSEKAPTAPAVDGSAFSWICVSSVPLWYLPHMVMSEPVPQVQSATAPPGLAGDGCQVVESPGVERRTWMPSASLPHGTATQVWPEAQWSFPVHGVVVAVLQCPTHAAVPTVRKTRPLVSPSAVAQLSASAGLS